MAARWRRIASSSPAKSSRCRRPQDTRGGRPRPAKGQRWRASALGGFAGFNRGEPFVLGERGAIYWRVEGREHTGWRPESFTDGTLEYVDTPSGGEAVKKEPLSSPRGESAGHLPSLNCYATGCAQCKIPAPQTADWEGECKRLIADVVMYKAEAIKLAERVAELEKRAVNAEAKVDWFCRQQAVEISRVATLPGRTEASPWQPSCDPDHWIPDV